MSNNELDEAIINKEPYISYEISETLGLIEIQYLYVPKELCGKGIGTALLADTIEDIRNFSELPIEVGALAFNHCNIPNHNLADWYERRGFEIVSWEADVIRMRYRG